MKQPHFTLFIILFALFILTKTAAQTKNGITITDKTKYFASYSYEYQEDSTSTSSRKQQEMWLLIGEKRSQFAHNYFFRLDSMFFECPDINDQNNMLKIHRQLRGDGFSHLTGYRIIKNKDSHKTDFYEIISSTYYHIPEEISFDWQLINKPDTFITRYICKEAQTTFRGRRYKAWYTLSIPVSDGPYKFKGLPGLIIKLEDMEKEHCFTLTSFEKINRHKPMTFWDRKFIPIKARQYPKIKHTQMLDKMQKYGNPQVVNISPEKLGNIEAKILRRNNLIERF